MQSPPGESYIIVGAGVFGASTALHLIRKYPTASIKLIDREPFPCQLGASWDWNKCIRAEYLDVFYMQMALEAKEIWATDPLYKPFYHEDGMVWISDTDMADVITENYKKIGSSVTLQRYTVDEAKKLYGGLLDQADFTGVDRILVGPNTGWAEAANALRAVIQKAVDEGVKYVNATVKSLVFNDAGGCVGIRTGAEEVITGSKIILCTGATTAKLLADSAPDRDDLQAGDRFTAAGMCTALMTPGPEACKRFKGLPTISHERVHHEGRGGFIPPMADGTSFKWWADISFSNNTIHPSGRIISTPPEGPYQGQWDVPKFFRDEMEEGKKVIFGDKADDLSFDTFRFCWEATSPGEDWFITPHTACKNLYIATIGSFHAFKFLPTLGRYIIQMLEGELDVEVAKRWSWDRPPVPPGGRMYFPERDLKDIVKNLN